MGRASACRLQARRTRRRRSGFRAPPRGALVWQGGELAELRRAFDGLQAQRLCRLSRLSARRDRQDASRGHELRDEVRGDATVLLGHCVCYGRRRHLPPLREAVEQSGGDLAAVLAGAGSIGEEHLEHAPLPRIAARRNGRWCSCSRTSSGRGPSLLDLVEYLGEHAVDAPLLVLCLARPELLEARPRWVVALTLAPLPDEQIVTLLDRLAGDVEPPLRFRLPSSPRGTRSLQSSCSPT